MRRSSSPYAAASMPRRKSGSVTISTSGTPARFRSIRPASAPLSRPAPAPVDAPPLCVFFPASSSRCTLRTCYPRSSGSGIMAAKTCRKRHRIRGARRSKCAHMVCAAEALEQPMWGGGGETEVWQA